MVIVNQRPNTVEITAQGYLANLMGAQPNLTYNLDLQSAGEGEQIIPLTPAGVQVSPASGLRIVRVSPARITIALERVVSKNVPVKVPTRGTPAAGVDLYKLTFQPALVSVSGPRSAVNPIKEVSTDPVSIVDKSRSFHTTVNFILQSDDILTSPVGPVDVDVELGPHREARTLRIPITVLDGDGYTVSPSTVSVSVLVPLTYKGNVTVEDFRATVTAPSLEAAADRIPVKPEVELATALNADIVIRQVNPEEVLLIRKVRKK
jgi:YbbR domain-containing protein